MENNEKLDVQTRELNNEFEALSYIYSFAKKSTTSIIEDKNIINCVDFISKSIAELHEIKKKAQEDIEKKTYI